MLSDPWKISPPGMWLIIGIVLATIEFLLPQKINKKFKLIPIILGCSALLEALILWGGSSLYMFDWRMVMYDEFEWQIFYWMGLSLAGIIWVRPTFTHWRNRFSIGNKINHKALGKDAKNQQVSTVG
ncbi:MAG: hypothetical protein MGG11_06985 [Trichodesmium sp. MAG_R03]|nr:hypothetical protein [Trichodesmium sp. MAG_R03]